VRRRNVSGTNHVAEAECVGSSKGACDHSMHERWFVDVAHTPDGLCLCVNHVVPLHRAVVNEGLAARVALGCACCAVCWPAKCMQRMMRVCRGCSNHGGVIVVSMAATHPGLRAMSRVFRSDRFQPNNQCRAHAGRCCKQEATHSTTAGRGVGQSRRRKSGLRFASLCPDPP
jgi:hypothetical protein